MLNVTYPYEVNWQLVTENGSLTPICSLSKRSSSSSLTVYCFDFKNFMQAVRSSTIFPFYIRLLFNTTFFLNSTKTCPNWSWGLEATSARNGQKARRNECKEKGRKIAWGRSSIEGQLISERFFSKKPTKKFDKFLP